MSSRTERMLVIDAGTSALRALAVDRAGVVSRAGSSAWATFVPEDAAPFGREVEGAWLAEQVDALAEGTGGEYAAIATTGQREGLVFADERGEALLVSPNVDARASGEGMAIDSKHAAEVYEATGHLPSLMQARAKWAWVRTNRPEIAERVRTIVPMADWIAWRLSGWRVMTRSLGIENGMLDVRSGGVIDGIGPELVPTVVRDGERMGDREGVPVVVAGGDTQCALVGMGAVHDDECGVAAGWSASVQMVTDKPLIDPGLRTWTGAHVAEGRWIVESNAGEMGRAFDWMCSLFGLTYEDGERLASGAAAGSSDVMVVLGPRAMSAARMNAGIGGVTFGLPLVMSAPDRGAMLRSVLEATACAVRANVEQIEEVSGRRATALRLGGGMSRSETFGQILADVLDRPVEVARAPETSAAGAAVLASVAAGLHASIDDAVAAMTEPRRTIEARAKESAMYDDVYGRWCGMCDAFEAMAEL